MQPDRETERENESSAFGCGGCFKIAAALGVLLLIIGLGLSAYFVSTPTGKGLVKVASEGYQFFQEVTKAPGTDELRALGCQMATVVTVKQMSRLIEAVDKDSEQLRALRGAQVGAIVSCEIPASASLPNCDQVARTYVDAVKPSAAFAVSIRQAAAAEVDGQEDEPELCNGHYTANGIKQGPFNVELLNLDLQSETDASPP